MRYNKCLHRDKLKGFSLVEMLVAVAILGILAALIIGFLRQSTERARSVHCINNLRQIGSLVHLYVGEFNGRLPTWIAATNPTGGNWMWDEYCQGFNFLGQPIGGYLPNMAGYNPQGLTLEAYRQVGARHTFNCPANRNPHAGVNRKWVGYVANQEVILRGPLMGRPFAGITRPSERIMFTDGMQDATTIPAGGVNFFTKDNWQDGIGFHRHEGRANAVFVDGSVRSLAPTDIEPHNIDPEL